MKKAALLFWAVLCCWPPARAEVLPGDIDPDEGSVTGEPMTEDGNRLADPAVPRTAGIFSGDMRFRVRNVNPRGNSLLSAPAEAGANTYLYQRTRLRGGRRVQAGWLFRRPSAGPPVTVGSLGGRHTAKASLSVAEIGPLERLVAGNYTLSHGQGLLFYDGLGELIRPVKVRPAGAAPDFTSSFNSYLRGAAMDLRRGPVEASLFVSEKPLDLRVDPATGRVAEDLDRLRDFTGEGYVPEGKNILPVRERLAGGRAGLRFADRQRIGVTAYGSRYGRAIDPKDNSFAASRVFRGSGNAMAGLDFDLFGGPVNVFGEAALSRASGPGSDGRRGRAWTVTPLLEFPPWRTWFGLYDHGPDFFTRHGQGMGASPVSRNQRGGSAGLLYAGARFSGEANYGDARFPEGSGNGTGSSPVGASSAREIFLRGTWALTRALSLTLRSFTTEEDRLAAAVPGGVPQATRGRTLRRRGELSWRTDAAGLRVRHETRAEEDLGNGSRAFGHLLMADAFYRPADGLVFKARFYAFDSPEANLTTGVEEIWDGVIYNRLVGAMNDLRGAPGTRFYLIVERKLGETWALWMKYDVNQRTSKYYSAVSSRADREQDAFGAVRQGFHVQLDCRWGG